MINHDAALAYLEYYGEDAMGITIVSPRVRVAPYAVRRGNCRVCLAPRAARHASGT